jgi:RNA-directed DNA polymerase
LFVHVISLENLFSAWKEFKRGKTSKLEVQEFAFHLEDTIFQLHVKLKRGIWKPDSYRAFYVRDPKLRHIHKATVRDRVFNQALFRVLYQIFDKGFITDSYSCREAKGTHRGVIKLKKYIRNISRNYTKPTLALKCDVQKFFDNIDHEILFTIIKRKITDPDVLSLIQSILKSFETRPGVGLPLGNVTSQLFANVYLNELDQFVKHTLKAKYYLRYCDDFIILATDQQYLRRCIQDIDIFLQDKLHLFLHPHKIIMRKCNQGIDFLGYVVLPKHTVLRTKTKKRVLRKIDFLTSQVNLGQITPETFDQIIQSYLGMLTHCAGYKIRNQIIPECATNSFKK